MRAAVASPHHLASAAGLDVLRDGGNAVDAAVAINLTLGVVAPYLCGYGGDLFALVWDDGTMAGYAGAGRAPIRATPDAVGADRMPLRGPKTVTVPGAVEAWFKLLDAFGTRSFDELSAAALRYARDGFELSDRGRRGIGGLGDAGDEAWRAIYGGARERLVQPDLARTIVNLAVHGPDAYYRGEIAAAIAAATGAWLTTDDLALHRGAWVEPISVRFRDLDVFELPPPTQGACALEALRIAEGFDTSDEHLLVEAMKLALADRDMHLYDGADPAPLLSDAWIEERRAHVRADRALAPAAGSPMRGGTAYMCAADPGGMCVSLIQSNYAGFGSGVTVPGWGINLQNRGAYFSLDPSHPNVLAGGKRTLHTLIPAMALRDGRPWLVFGTMGADAQAQIHLQLLVRIVDRGMTAQQAIDAPRWWVRPDDWTVLTEEAFDDTVLTSRGHSVAPCPPAGHANAIEVRSDGYVPACDPRSESAALGLE